MTALRDELTREWDYERIRLMEDFNKLLDEVLSCEKKAKIFQPDERFLLEGWAKAKKKQEIKIYEDENKICNECLNKLNINYSYQLFGIIQHL